MKKNTIFLICIAITVALFLGACGQISSNDNVNTKVNTSGITDIGEKILDNEATQSNPSGSNSYSNEKSSSNTEGIRKENTAKIEGASAKKGYPLTVTDILGNTVELEKKPVKIAAISPQIIDVLLSCGVTSICSAEPEDGSTVKDSAKKSPSIGKASNPDIIAILELEPDLVFAEAGLQNEVISMLQKNKVPVIALKVDDQKSIQEAEKIMKEVVGFN